MKKYILIITLALFQVHAAEDLTEIVRARANTLFGLMAQLSPAENDLALSHFEAVLRKGMAEEDDGEDEEVSRRNLYAEIERIPNFTDSGQNLVKELFEYIWGHL